MRWRGQSDYIELLCRFTLDGEYEQTPFTETMIDHLDIESRIIVAECGEARLQVRRFGLPPLIGDNLPLGTVGQLGVTLVHFRHGG